MNKYITDPNRLNAISIDFHSEQKRKSMSRLLLLCSFVVLLAVSLAQTSLSQTKFVQSYSLTFLRYSWARYKKSYQFDQ